MFSRIESVVQDGRYAARSLRRFAVPNTSLVLLLALGIGATTAVLTLVERVLLAPLAAPEPQRLVLLRRVDAAGNRADGFSTALVEALRRGSRSVSSLTAYDYTRMDVRVGSVTEQAPGRLLSGSGFALLGARPFLGRSLGSGDDAPNRANVALLTYNYWQRRFGADPAVIGSALSIDGTPVTIVGVLSPDFTGLSVGEVPEDLWLPMALHPTVGLKDHQEVGLIGHLIPNETRAAAAAELTSLYLDAQRAGVVSEPQVASGGNRSRIEVEPAAQGLADLPHRLEQPLRLLLAAALLLLVVVWINAAGLLATRTRIRARELAVRLAIGARRARLVQQLLVENLLITGLGAAAGALAAWWFVPLLVRVLVQDDGMPMIDPAPDLRVVIIVTGLAIALALLFAVVQLSAATRSDLTTMLRGGRGVSESRSLASAGRLLVSAQLAISLVLILDGLGVADAVRRVAAVNPGFDSERVLIFWLFPNSRGYAGAREQTLYRSVAERLAQIPDARGASVVRYRPGIARDATCRPTTAADAPADVFVNVVGPGYFTTMGIPFLAGRDLRWSDGPSTPAVAVIGATTARRLFPGRSPIGARLRLPGGSGDGVQIVGIVGDVSTYPMTATQATSASCDVYVPIGQASANQLGQMNVVVRAAGSSPTTLASALRGTVSAIDPELPVIGLASGGEVLHDFYGREQSLAWLVLGISVVALLVGVTGLYGTLTLGVTMRRRELGIRIALGATAADVQRLVMRQAASILAVGVAIGLVATSGSVAILRNMVFGLDRIGSGPALAAIAVLGVAAILAAFFPVRRAATVDPMLIVREE